MSKLIKTRFELAVAYKIAAMRREKSLTQSQLATMLEVSRGFIGQVESANFPTSYSLDQINRLAYEFECSIHDLIPIRPIREDSWDI